MAKLYKIRQGYSFLDLVDGKQVTKTGGEEILLADDCAAEHADKVELVQASAQPAGDEPQDET